MSFFGNCGCGCGCQEQHRCCERGPVGPMGPRGWTGPVGPTGATGATGAGGAGIGALLAFNGGNGAATVYVDKTAGSIQAVFVGNSSIGVQRIERGAVDLIDQTAFNMTIPKDGVLSGLSFYVKRGNVGPTTPTTVRAQVWINRAAAQNTIFMPLAGTEVVSDWPLDGNFSYTRGGAVFASPVEVFAKDRVVIVITVDNAAEQFGMGLSANATLVVENR